MSGMVMYGIVTGYAQRVALESQRARPGSRRVGIVAKRAQTAAAAAQRAAGESSAQRPTTGSAQGPGVSGVHILRPPGEGGARVSAAARRSLTGGAEQAASADPSPLPGRDSVFAESSSGSAAASRSSGLATTSRTPSPAVDSTEAALTSPCDEPDSDHDVAAR